MTVITLDVNVTYTGSGSVGPFSFNFPISTPAALLVIQNGTVLATNAYTIVPVNNNYDNGGLVTLNAPVPSGQPLVLQRSTPLTQTRVFADNLPQPMQQFEDSLDKLTEIVQEIVADMSGGGSGVQTYVVAGFGIQVTGTGTLTNPYVVSLAVALAITSFTGGQAGELGQSFINPAFNATYTGGPTSASITNTDGISSPTALTTPFTSGAVVGTFVHTAVATTTFTLSASNGSGTQTATQTITWQPAIFGGVGTGGASSTVTASGTTAVLSTGSVLPRAQLGAETVGQTFGPYTPAAQTVYLLLTGGSHSFIDATTGFPFAFNAPITVSFVNAHGATITMYLYASTNTLTGTFSPKITS